MAGAKARLRERAARQRRGEDEADKHVIQTVADIEAATSEDAQSNASIQTVEGRVQKRRCLRAVNARGVKSGPRPRPSPADAAKRNHINYRPLSLVYWGSIFSRPPMYGRRASGMVSEPSSFWYVSRRATRARPTARPEPLIVWQKTGFCGFPFASSAFGR